VDLNKISSNCNVFLFILFYLYFIHIGYLFGSEKIRKIGIDRWTF